MQLPFHKQKFSRDSTLFQAIVPGGSVALCIVVALIFWLQPDWCAAMLVLPRWMWIAPGLLLALLGWTRKRRRMVGVAAALWFLYAVFFTQEFRSVFRTRSTSENNSAIALRVISLNCNGGDEDAAAEVAAFHPDLALFEESPLRPKVREMAPKNPRPGRGKLLRQ